jgi:hypothetical protein
MLAKLSPILWWIGNTHGCAAEQIQDQPRKQSGFIAGTSAVMHHTRAEGQIRIRAIVRSRVTTDWSSDP